MWLRSQVAVAAAVVEAGRCSSNSTSSLETYVCHVCGPKKTKDKKRKRKKTNNNSKKREGVPQPVEKTRTLEEVEFLTPQ